MSRGPGAIQRKLLAIFTKDARGVFTTEMLCHYVYNIEKVQKKHRVSILRAIKRLAGSSMPTLWRKAAKFQRDDEWYDYRCYPGRAHDRAPAAEARPRKR
jgi:hypothetical protein